MVNCHACGRSMGIDSPFCPGCGAPRRARVYVPDATGYAHTRKKTDSTTVRAILFAAVCILSIVIWQLYSRVDAAQNQPDNAAASSHSVSP